MIQRFLFNGIDTEAARSTIGQQHDLPFFAAAHKAQSTLSLTQLSSTRTYITLDAAVWQDVPILRGYRLRRWIIHCSPPWIGRSSVRHVAAILPVIADSHWPGVQSAAALPRPPGHRQAIRFVRYRDGNQTRGHSSQIALCYGTGLCAN